MSDPQAPPEKPLPIALRWLEGRLVVMATGAPDRVSVGDVILEVDGRPASAWMAEAEALQSGSPHHRAWRAVRALVRGPEGRRLSLELERGGERVRVELAHGGGRSPWSEPRPASIGEVRPGIWYVDLERARWAQVQPRLPELARAPAVVFDMRGYPSDAAAILGHLLKGPLQASWLHVPKIVEPFGRFLEWHDLTRSPPPALPRLEGKIVFLADARAVSAAESLLGDVAFQRLGTVVGGPTAGANGMAITFPLPSGMSVTFTGARVTRHDGRVFHLHGVPPTVPVVPTLEGIRAGRDEVLERALALAGADPSPD